VTAAIRSASSRDAHVNEVCLRVTSLVNNLGVSAGQTVSEGGLANLRHAARSSRMRPDLRKRGVRRGRTPLVCGHREDAACADHACKLGYGVDFSQSPFEV
jgi:hypothetical protein